jgi:hypothetical protein
MSADRGSDVGSKAVSGAARNFALRIALGVTASFGIAEGLDWEVTFLAPMLASQFLITMMHPPPFRQALSIVAIIALASGGMAYLAAGLVATPPALVLALGLILYLSFYAHARGAPDMLTLMIQISAVTVPVFTVISPGAGAAFAGLFAKASVVAVLMVWIAFAVFPSADTRLSPDSPAQTPRIEAAAAARLALRNMLIIMPILMWYLLDANQVAVVMLVTIVMLLRQIEENGHARMAFALILANLLGGIAANIAYFVVGVADQFVIYIFVLLAASLGFAGQIARGGTRAALLAAAFGTFILLLGIGLSPVPGGSASAFISRIGYVLLAALYTIGALSLFEPRKLTGRATGTTGSP